MLGRRDGSNPNGASGVSDAGRAQMGSLGVVSGLQRVASPLLLLFKPPGAFTWQGPRQTLDGFLPPLHPPPSAQEACFNSSSPG